jgi:predicted dithiol-disulfide oxidoreductase (DUF899 family)
MLDHPIASREAWLDARRALLAEEKAYTHARDALAEKRRALPWVKVDKDYEFEGPNGRLRLADLFGEKRQLIVYHFMFGPGWQEGCVGCSFLIDHLNGILTHLDQKNVAFTAVSRAPYAELAAFRRRMGWSVPWVSSGPGDFNFDYGVSFTPEQMAGAPAVYNFDAITPPVDELPGFSVFVKTDDGQIFHTYSSYARAGEDVLGTYALLDMTPLGRDEGELGNLGQWVRHHDRYGQAGQVEQTGRYVPELKAEAEACPACAVAE